MKTPCLIVATTGRALARSARRGGHPVVVLDLFADCDTRRYATVCRRLPARGWDFDAAATLAAAGEFCPPPAPLVIGSGFENRPELLGALAEGRRFFGNTPATIAATKDPQRFFALLDDLGIAHPETTRQPPAAPAGWLVKSVGASGGIHVRPARQGERAAPEIYFQRRVDGRSGSVLFLADGQRARVIGYNELWATDSRDAPFAYAGAINRVTLPPPLRRRIAADLDALVEALGLVGLNGMDFVIAGDDYLVLEINPRPTATMDLHDDHHCGCLFDLHMQACAGQLPASLPPSKAVRAHAVVYAPTAGRLAPSFAFPDWCSDLPAGDAGFAAGMPVCMVHASGTRCSDVKHLVRQRRTALENIMVEHAA